MQSDFPPSVVGYARVSSADQSEAGQSDALRLAGAARVVVERASGVADLDVEGRVIGTTGEHPFFA